MCYLNHLMVLKLKPSNKIENARLIAVVYCVIDNIFSYLFFFFKFGHWHVSDKLKITLHQMQCHDQWSIVSEVGQQNLSP